MTDDLQYPIGKFAAPGALDAAAIVQWRRDLAELPGHMRAAVSGLTNAQLDMPYRDGGWTVRQVVHHVADSHLNAYCRFRLALTEDAPTIKPYSEARWAELPDARTLPVASSLEMLDGMHLRWVAMIDALTSDQWQRTFVHPAYDRSMALWQTAALYAWHSRHHVAHITNLGARQNW